MFSTAFVKIGGRAEDKIIVEDLDTIVEQIELGSIVDRGDMFDGSPGKNVTVGTGVNTLNSGTEAIAAGGGNAVDEAIAAAPV